MPDYPNKNYKADSAKVSAILQANPNLNFVQRILSPKEYPVLALGNGDYASHKMASGEVDGQYIVYPEVIHDTATNSLRQLDRRAAIEHALAAKEFIPFKTPEEADWFSRMYKSYWGPNGQPPK